MLVLLWFVLSLLTAAVDYDPGDIPLDWRPFVVNNISEMMGRWKLIPEESDSIEEILSKLGVGWFKRRALRNYASVTEIGVTTQGAAAFRETNAVNLTSHVVPLSDDAMTPLGENKTKPWIEGEEGSALASTEAPEIIRREITITTFFPYNNVKGGVIPLTGDTFKYKDADTGYWSATADYVDGRLLQKRTSSDWGVMYDVRVIFAEPEIRKIKNGTATPWTEAPGEPRQLKRTTSEEAEEEEELDDTELLELARAALEASEQLPEVLPHSQAPLMLFRVGQHRHIMHLNTRHNTHHPPHLA
eukprot:Blabericola_migrator_1__13366@NODE_948_length_5913_cov_205_487342_g658_i0_p5_GENE_NODE_948_length_5913_cov_205_487342_g658_i0NODE_948_length_5913_cov_205_487342_g658_i0_p5_ORF_typecomplete_len302_score49_71Lipocalin_7/PF14651_6/0_32Lipocalin_7/PF14651_6/2_4e03Lipocalin_7/PF14651_6/6_4e03_NODE_948_length_5913_cov_205_487342_g658_i017002605